MTTPTDPMQKLRDERNRIASLLNELAEGRHVFEVSHGDIADFQRELVRLDLLLAQSIETTR